MPSGLEDRTYWLSVLDRIARPVLTALSQRRLKATMPVECRPGLIEDRENFTYLEALGRTLTGIAPWLENGPRDGGAEGRLCEEFRNLARASIGAAVDPESPDAMNFTHGRQPVVDGAFLAQALVRAPRELWQQLDHGIQRRVADALRATRVHFPSFNNWLLFAAMIEAALCAIGEPDWDTTRIDYGLRQHEQWYVGDGAYSDGPRFHWDWYNAFVIQPMMVEVVEIASAKAPWWDDLKSKILPRARRFAAVQERMISPEGTIPPIGRSLAYRFGALQGLAQMALRRQLPDSVTPAQVRCAMTALIRRMIEAPGTFDARGWLTIGLVGHQPGIGENYISTGSVYLCTIGLLPPGLAADDEFWSAPPAKWTSQKVWSGEDVPMDTALKN